jgi:hypothetical protein
VAVYTHNYHMANRRVRVRNPASPTDRAPANTFPTNSNSNSNNSPLASNLSMGRGLLEVGQKAVAACWGSSLVRPRAGCQLLGLQVPEQVLGMGHHSIPRTTASKVVLGTRGSTSSLPRANTLSKGRILSRVDLRRPACRPQRKIRRRASSACHWALQLVALGQVC